MGLQDRDYTQNNFNRKKRRPRRSDGSSAVITLIVINFALWIINGFLFSKNNDLTELLLFDEKLFFNPLECYRLLTYGFVHAPQDWTHIVFNMFGLVMFGYGMMLGIGPGGFGLVRGDNVENKLGKWEFVTFYLLTITIGGVVFALINLGDRGAGVLGASGGVCGVIILYAWMFPNKTLLLYGILPMPMWALGVMIVAMDAWGAAGGLGGAVAYPVHLAGAACGTLYYHLLYKQQLRLTDMFDGVSLPKRKPDIKIHTPKDPTTSSSDSDDKFNRRLDEILKRYGEVGESGLTAEEREFLQRASRKFAEKHHKR